MDVVEPIKFLYAADLRLDRPLALGEGASGAFAHLARDVAYEATRRLVGCALARDLDFVLLRGELFDAHCGARALHFLAEQTRRLSRAGIPCYILNEGPAVDARWLAEFPAGVRWLEPKDEEIAASNRLLPLTQLLEPAPLPLQGVSHDENGPKGALFVSLPSDGEPEREFIELDALRWEHCEMDVTPIETEEDLTASWKTIKDTYREREAKRPVLLHVKLTGVMKNMVVFYGKDFTPNHEVLMKKLNADEIAKKYFVLADSLTDCAISPTPRQSSSNDALEADFWGEMAFFNSGLDLRVGLFDALKERSFLKRILATDTAPFLENVTEADVESILKESCDAAIYWLSKAREPK